jgi:hypothetical protein
MVFLVTAVACGLIYGTAMWHSRQRNRMRNRAREQATSIIRRTNGNASDQLLRESAAGLGRRVRKERELRMTRSNIN